MNKLEERRQRMKEEVRRILKENNFDHRTIGTRALIEIALENAVIYKYQKVLLMVELTANCTDGDYQ